MVKTGGRFRVKEDALHMLIFTLYKTLNIICLRDQDSWEKRNHMKKIIDGTQEDTKYFPFNEISKSNLGVEAIKSWVIGETTQEQESSDSSHWIKPIFSNENNCTNLQQVSTFEPMKESEGDKGSLDDLPGKKTNFTMAHHFYASQFKNLRGSCRTCSRDVNRNSTDSYGLLIMDSGFHIHPDCLMKLSMVQNSGFTVRLGIYIESGRLYEIEEIEVPDQHFMNVFMNLFQDIFALPHLNNKIQQVIKISDFNLTKCMVQGEIKKTPKSKFQTGAIEEALKQGYYPLFDDKSGEKLTYVEQAKLTQKIGEVSAIISRSCNPYLYTDAVDVLSRDHSVFEEQSDLTDPNIDEWPLLYLGLTDNLRIKIQDELKYNRDHPFLQQTIIKGIKSESFDELIEIGIDTTKFWM